MGEGLGGGGVSKWNTIKYDNLSRPTEQLHYTGRKQTFAYNGLTSTTTDGPKTIKVTVDANGNKRELWDNTEKITHNYYANGNVKETLYGSHKISLQYDGWGRKTYMLDPSVSSKAYTYEYNNFGELVKEVMPTGTTIITYTTNGKVTKKTSVGQNTNSESNYFYNSKGLVTSETGNQNGKVFSYSFGYNTLWQQTYKTEVTPNNLTNTKSFTYDGQGRLLRETTSSYLTSNTAVNNGNVVIEYKYTNGILEQFSDVTVPTSPKVLWKLNTANEKMNVLTASLGNGMNVTNTYDAADYLKTSRHQTSTTTALNLTYDFKADRGTLNSRRNTITGLFDWNETFTYDNFERLLSWTDPTGTASNTYETDGRIKTNNLVGTYNYDPTNRYKKIAADLNGTGETYYRTRGKQTIAYNMFKNPISVEETQLLNLI